MAEWNPVGPHGSFAVNAEATVDFIMSRIRDILNSGRKQSAAHGWQEPITYWARPDEDNQCIWIFFEAQPID